MIRLAAAGLLAAALVWTAAALHGDPDHGPVASFTVLAGSAFGFVLQRSRFCFASAFRDLFLLRDRRGLLGVLAALAAGSVGYAVVLGAQVPDPSRYLHPTAHIAPAGWHLAVGGLSFGIGMVLAGGCISGALYRLGEGSLLAPITLLGAVAGYWAATWAWNFVYVNAIAAGPIAWLPRWLGYGGALAIQLSVLACLAALLLWKCSGLPSRPRATSGVRDALQRTFVNGWPAWMGGIAVGALATGAFFRASPLGVTAELGRISLLLGQGLGLAPGGLLGMGQLPGCRSLDGTAPSQNAVFVVSLVAGSMLAALLAGEFRLRTGRPRACALAAAGGVLLGFGAMISLGCTVGTLLSGIMAFSLSGWIFGAGLLAGAWAGGRILRLLA